MTSAPRTGFRSDIQGLRAVAVLLVVAVHLTGRPIGGFIGVDVFFVVSGFLITGVLLRRNASHGRISFLHFYKARARRILPASLATLAACWLVGHLLFHGVRVHQNTTDVEWALGFAANIHFEQVGTDYFQTSQAPSLVQHYWSLAVEEQFYLLWPLLMLLVLTCLTPLVRRLRTRLLVLAFVIAVASVSSLAYSWHETDTEPTKAYFSTLTRAWELGIGAALAVVLSRSPQLARRIAPVRGPVMLIGVATLVASAFLIRPTSGFPAPAAVVPLAATALVIGAGSAGDAGRWSWILTNRVFVYLGLVSYSLYLWHWPTIVAAQALFNDRGPYFYAATLSAVAALTLVSYHFIEAPFRDAGFRDTVSARYRGQVSRPRILLGATTAAVFAATCYTLKPEPALPDYSAAAAVVSAHPSRSDHVANASPALARGIADALTATTFPELEPDLDHLGLAPAARDWSGCNTDSSILPTCTFRPSKGRLDPKKVAVVLGDSIALAWLPGVRKALTTRGWTVYGLARQQCSPADAAQIALTQAQAAGCDRLHAFYPAAAKVIKPTLVIMSSLDDSPYRLRTKARGWTALAQYRRALTRTIKVFSAPGTSVVDISGPPSAKQLVDCDTAASRPSSCVGTISESWQAHADADAQVAAATHTRYLDTHLWFCSAKGYCPAFVGHTPIRYDGEHLTRQYSSGLAGLLAHQLLTSSG